MDPKLNAQILAQRAETEAVVSSFYAAQAAAAPANAEVQRLTDELNRKIRELDERHKAEEAALYVEYEPLLRQAWRQVQQAEAAWAQQQQAQQAEEARRRQVDAQARQVAAQRQAVQQAAEEARRRGMTLDAYLASLRAA